MNYELMRAQASSNYNGLRVQSLAQDVAALAASGCDAEVLSLAVSALREGVTEFAQSARAYRKVAAK
jgi:hypothetical protein